MDKSINAFQIKYNGPGQLFFIPHISNIGWTNFYSNMDIGGDPNSSDKFEAILFKMKDGNGSISSFKAKAYVADSGWKKGGLKSVIGTTGESRSIYLLKVTIKI